MIKNETLAILGEIGKVGSLSCNQENGTLQINLMAEYSKRYRKAILRLVEDIARRGKFDVVIDQDSLTITHASDLFYRALKQEMFNLGLLVSDLSKSRTQT